MRHVGKIITVTIFAMAVGCVQRASDHPIKKVLPRADDVKIEVPETQAAATWTLGEIADYYVITREISRDLNGGAAWVLILVHTIVHFPPTTVDGNVYTWGPWSDALDPADWRLVVTENADGSYDWSFDGKSKLEADAEFITVISGNAVPGLEPHRGSGNFFIDFDAAEEVDPIDNDNVGTVEIVYDLENRDGTPATLDMVIASRQLDENGVEEDVSFDYSYVKNLDGSGDLQFEIHGDLDDGGTAFEDAVIRSRWLATGAGRADIRVSNGDLEEGVSVEASECWNELFRRVYYIDTMEWMPTEGDVADCAFVDQDLPDA